MANNLNRKFSCPVELSLEILGGKWKPVILAHLKNGPKRYGALRQLIPRLSDKMLTQRVRDLEEQGLIQRFKRGHAVVEYALSARGQTLKPVLEALYGWGEFIAPEVGAVIESRGDRPPDSAGSCYALAADLAGNLEGPSDLASNPVHMKKFGR